MPRNDGKYLEKLCIKYVESLNLPEVWIHKLNDSGMARNLTKEQPADFIVSTTAETFLLECKSCKHRYRLPKFVQLPRMKRAELAGLSGKLLVHHWEIDVYRVININGLSLAAASHDLRGYAELTVEQALTEVFK